MRSKKVDESVQYFGEANDMCPDGFTVMQSERPIIGHVAREEGMWVLPAYMSTIDEKIAALDGKYQPQLDAPSIAWATASMDGNTDLAASIKEDKDTMKHEYQNKREAIVNGN